jgi:hypothetical protein
VSVANYFFSIPNAVEYNKKEVFSAVHNIPKGNV